tara:strand:+ start:612 stop:875 length:264 start_codon:yes stop_codon:yes gene_type:complete
MATTNIAKAIKEINPDAEFKYMGNDIDTIEWLNSTTPISKSDIETKMAELPSDEEDAQARENLKASAKAKLIAGEALTEEEANTIVI